MTAIAAGGQGNESISLAAPNQHAGTYFYGATIDLGGDASGAVSVVVAEALATEFDGNASSTAWLFSVPSATGATTTILDYSGNAGSATWTVNVPSATGTAATVAEASGNAVGASWAFQVPSAVGATATLGPEMSSNPTFNAPIVTVRQKHCMA